MPDKVWFITGASRGFGRIWAEAALARGDKVAVTARDPADVADLRERYGDAALPLALDVTDGAQVERALAATVDAFGRIDVLLNNAGYALIGTVEEAREADVRAMFDANYFGTLKVIQAALPRLRAQGSGHIVGVSSGLGVFAMPVIGFYATTKWAVEALHESLAQEVRGFGIRVSLIEPGAYATEFASEKSRRMSPELEAYAPLRERMQQGMASQQRGDPAATADAVLALVDAEDPPLRLALGTTVLPRARQVYAERIATWEQWQAVSDAAQGKTSGHPGYR